MMTPSCPRCRVFLVERRKGMRSVSWCPRCEGLWLDGATLADLERRTGRSLLGPAAAVVGLEGPAQGDLPEPPCAECGEPMTAHALGTGAGVVVDACARHGVWLDGEELLQLAAFIQEGVAELTCSPEHEHLVLAAAFEPVFELLGCR